MHRDGKRFDRDPTRVVRRDRPDDAALIAQPCEESAPAWPAGQALRERVRTRHRRWPFPPWGRASRSLRGSPDAGGPRSCPSGGTRRTRAWTAGSRRRWVTPAQRRTMEHGPSAPMTTVRPQGERLIAAAAEERPSPSRTGGPPSRSARAHPRVGRGREGRSKRSRSIMPPGASRSPGRFVADERAHARARVCTTVPRSSGISRSSMTGTYSAHCTGSPITRRRSTTTTRAPARAAAPAAAEPAGPAPTTRTSQVAGSCGARPGRCRAGRGSSSVCRS